MSWGVLLLVPAALFGKMAVSAALDLATGGYREFAQHMRDSGLPWFTAREGAVCISLGGAICAGLSLWSLCGAIWQAIHP